MDDGELLIEDTYFQFNSSGLFDHKKIRSAYQYPDQLPSSSSNSFGSSVLTGHHSAPIILYSRHVSSFPALSSSRPAVSSINSSYSSPNIVPSSSVFKPSAPSIIDSSTTSTSGSNKNNATRFLYHFYIDELFLSSLELKFLWAGPEEYLDTVDMKLLQNGLWLRYREIHYGFGSEKMYSQFILQNVNQYEGDLKSSVIGYDGTQDVMLISKEISRILGFEISPSDLYDFSKLFVDFDILTWANLWTHRFLADDGVIYIDVVQFAGESNFYIIGGIDCSRYSKKEDRDAVRKHQSGVVQPSYSKPMQQLVLSSCYEDIWKKYEVNNCQNNLCLNQDDLTNKYHLKLFDSPLPKKLPRTHLNFD